MSIGVDYVPLIGQASSSIFLQKFSTSCPGWSVSLIFLQGLEKRVGGGRVDLLLLLGDGPKDLVTRGVVPEVFFNSLSELDRDRCKHSLYYSICIVSVRGQTDKK